MVAYWVMALGVVLLTEQKHVGSLPYFYFCIFLRNCQVGKCILSYSTVYGSRGFLFSIQYSTIKTVNICIVSHSGRNNTVDMYI